MGKLIVVLALLLCASSAWAQSAYVQSKGSGSANVSTVAFTSNLTAGNFILCLQYDGNAINEAIGCTDSQGNTFTTPSAANNTRANIATDGDTIGVSCAGPVSSGADTVHFQQGGTDTTMKGVIYEISGLVNPCTLDVANSNNALAQTACSSGSITTNFANDFIVGWCGTANAQSAFTAGSGWTNLTNINSTMTNNDGAGEVVTGSNSSGSSFNAQETYPSSSEMTSIVAAWKGTGGGGGSTCPQTVLGVGCGVF